MAKLKDTYVNGNLSVSGNINVTGLFTGIDIDIDTELVEIYQSIEDVVPFPIEDDEEITPS